MEKHKILDQFLMKICIFIVCVENRINYKNLIILRGFNKLMLNYYAIFFDFDIYINIK
jgi:hypothetical protein